MTPDAPPPRSTPPRTIRRRTTRFDLTEASLRRRSFWVGWGGWVITLFIGLLTVGLLVGWVLLWVDRPETSMTLLTVGCVAFTLVLGLLGTLQNRLVQNMRLRQAEAAFLAGVSHNLRTPIGAIRAAAQALSQPGLEADQRKRLLGAIVHETRRLGLRVDNVLETGRLEVERLSFSPEAVDLIALVELKANEARGVIEARGGTLTVEHEDPPIVIGGDDRALRLLIDNLMDNAVKYSDGAPDVRIAVRKRPPFGLIQVKDAGIGFGSEEVSLLFQRFGRGDTGRAGTGLGLPLARAIARGHGGDVHLHSDGKGCGTVSEVWLPLVEEG